MKNHICCKFIAYTWRIQLILNNLLRHLGHFFPKNFRPSLDPQIESAGLISMNYDWPQSHDGYFYLNPKGLKKCGIWTTIVRILDWTKFHFLPHQSVPSNLPNVLQISSNTYLPKYNSYGANVMFHWTHANHVVAQKIFKKKFIC